MRISEEIDALEVMGIKSIAYLASTRILAGLVVIIPLYALGMIMSFLSAQVTTVFYGQSIGTYDTTSGRSCAPTTCLVVRGGYPHCGGRDDTHCYYGYNASGGPVGVGEAVGRSMRFSLITIVVVLSC
jgi:phospholipid/cholesterol/gamma-HCH transport system permease protein